MDYVYYSGLGILSLMIYNKDNIINYITSLKILKYYPGQGEIVVKGRNNYFIKTDEDDIRLNYIKSPECDLLVYLFKKDIVLGETLLSLKQLEENFKDIDTYQIKNHNMGIIDDVYHTENIKKGKVYGYIKSYIRGMAYIFVIEPGVIDFKKIFKNFKNEIENYDM
jgi:hypothetical protein